MAEFLPTPTHCDGAKQQVGFLARQIKHLSRRLGAEEAVAPQGAVLHLQEQGILEAGLMEERARDDACMHGAERSLQGKAGSRT